MSSVFDDRYQALEIDCVDPLLGNQQRLRSKMVDGMNSAIFNQGVILQN
jgi:hypothetical protein